MKKIGSQQAISMAHKHYQLKQYVQVKRILQLFIQRGVQNVDVCYFMASAHYCLNEYEQVVEAYRCGIKINPDYLDVYYNLVYVYSATGQADNAIILCGQILDKECNADSLEIVLESKYV